MMYLTSWGDYSGLYIREEYQYMSDLNWESMLWSTVQVDAGMDKTASPRTTNIPRDAKMPQLQSPPEKEN